MRLAIDGVGYTTASTAFTTANHVAAQEHHAFLGELAGYAAMAGDDSTSADFASSYDAGAEEAVGALGDLVGSFARLGQLTTTAMSHHREAEGRSIITGTVVYDGCVLDPDSYATVLPATPVSSLGGDTSGLPSEFAWIIDHVQGFVWPNADTDRLHDAARSWSRAAGQVDDLGTYCDSAVRGFGQELSPRSRSPSAPRRTCGRPSTSSPPSTPPCRTPARATPSRSRSSARPSSGWCATCCATPSSSRASASSWARSPRG